MRWHDRHQPNPQNAKPTFVANAVTEIIHPATTTKATVFGSGADTRRLNGRAIGQEARGAGFEKPSPKAAIRCAASHRTHSKREPRGGKLPKCSMPSFYEASRPDDQLLLGQQGVPA
jgi:hypothetical protein